MDGYRPCVRCNNVLIDIGEIYCTTCKEKLNLTEAERGQMDCKVIAKPEDCKGCAYNWGSFNTRPDDSYCYMFSEFMPGCKKYTTKL